MSDTQSSTPAGALLGEASIEIDAPAERVWSVLTDFAGYARWNPFTPELAAELRIGAPVAIKAMMWGVPFRQRGEVIEIESGRMVRWLVFPMPWGLAVASRVQRVEPLGPSRCRYTTEDRLRGPLGGPIAALTRSGVMRGFARAADGLKRAAESP